MWKGGSVIRSTAALVFLYGSFVGAVSTAMASSTPMVLEYRGRYLCQSGEPDHLMDVQTMSSNRLVVAGNRGLALIDTSRLSHGGSREYLDRLTGLNARNIYPAENGYLYVNLFRSAPDSHAGFAVVRVIADSLQLVTTRDEPETLYEKMYLSDGLLYVAAHRKGLRVFDLSNPADPVLLGRLDDGFVDAWAVTVDGDVAWVADGAGGLKKVDVSDPEHPRIEAGEDLSTAFGTAEDVTLRDDRVYVAGGGAGVLYYDSADIADRSRVEVGGAAKDFAWIGEHLAVATISGVAVLDVDPGDTPTIVAGEITSRRNNGTLRLCSAVGSFGSDGVLLADWNFMDSYRLVDSEAATQPDICCNRQRIRFAPEGGAVTVKLWNNGGGVLAISGAESSSDAFSVDLDPAALGPGEVAEAVVSYDGSPYNSSAVVSIHSDDPDEDPLPIQVFGNTQYLDPGEEAVDFELPVFHRDPDTGELVEEVFRLSDQLGKVVWFVVYGTW
jgi:hypothetical protein